MKKDTSTPKIPVRGYINLYYLRLQLAWAGWMERQSLKLGRRGLIVAFAAFVSVSACCCVVLITCGFGNIIPGSELQLTPINTIRIPNKTQPGIPIPDTAVVGVLQAFHAYMDSLALSGDGLQLRDSILRARPGLMDSIRMAESLYLTKKLNDHEK
jgi:hypothetical protein